MGDSSFRTHGYHFCTLRERKVPWQECSKMDERVRFVARLLGGEKMALLWPRVRHLAQDRLQDLSALQGFRRRWADRSQPPAVSAGDNSSSIYTQRCVCA